MLTPSPSLPTRMSAAPRIGYLLRMYPRFSQTFVVNEILELERQGTHVRILSLKKPTDGVFHESLSRVQAVTDYIPEAVWEKPGRSLSLIASRCRRAPRAMLTTLRAALGHRAATWLDLLQALHVLHWAEKHRIDHLHVHFGTEEATVALLVRLLGGPTYSLTLHAFDIFRNNVDRRLLVRKINHSAFTVTVSEFNGRYLRQLAGVDAARVRVNYNGIDLERFSDAGGPREDHFIFAIGRLIEKKGFRYLVEAVNRLRDDGLAVRCEIAGDGAEKKALQDQIAGLGLGKHVRLVGALGQPAVCARMQRAACFVLPCVQAGDGNIDALPTVLLEAMACECPTISTRLSGIPEIIEDRISGLLVEPASVPELADAIRRVLVNRTLAAQLARGGRRRAEERFDVRANVAVMHGWLGAAAGSKAPAVRVEQPPVTAASAA